MIPGDFKSQALNKTPTQLTKHYKKTRSTIYRWLTATGSKPYNPEVRTNDVWTARKDEIYRYYCDDGLTLKEIGLKYETTASNVFEAIKNHFPEFRDIRNKNKSIEENDNVQ